MGNWSYRMMEFMRGRRGGDQFNWFLFIAAFAVQLIGRIIRIRYVYYFGLLMFAFGIFRMFSRNIYKREKENQRYLSIKNRIANWNYFRKNKKQQGGGKKGPVYAFYYCPSCKQQIRVPVGKGRIRVTCPKCKEKFEMNT